MRLLHVINSRKARFALGLSAVCAFIPLAIAQDYYSSDAASAEVRIQQFETQIRELTGKIEEQDYQIRQLQEQLEKIIGDLSMRVDDLEKGRGNSSTSTSGDSSYMPPYPDRSIMGNDSGNSGSGGYQWDSARPGGGSMPGRLGTLTDSGSADGAAIQYENAFSALKNGDYDTAEDGFRSFIENNPDHVLAGNAKYWLGETYYVRGDFQTASRIFAEAYQQYPKSSKAPDNLLKLGMSLASLNKKDDACIALAQIETAYSTGAGPVLSRSKQEMARLGC